MLSLLNNALYIIKNTKPVFRPEPGNCNIYTLQIKLKISSLLSYLVKLGLEFDFWAWKRPQENKLEVYYCKNQLEPKQVWKVV